MRALDPRDLTDEDIIAIADLLGHGKDRLDDDGEGLSVYQLRLYEGFTREAERLKAHKPA